MFGLDLATVLVVVAITLVLFVALDILLAGGGMTSAAMGGATQSGAAMMSSPYGWALILVIIPVALGAFSFFFGYR